MNAIAPLRAATRIALATPAEVAHRLREHFAEHGVVAGTDAAWSVVFDIGTARSRLAEDALAIDVEAGDETSLAFLQWSVAEHVYEFAGGDRPRIRWRGGIPAGSPLPYLREMRVIRARRITPRMRRVTLAGPDLARFATGGLHVRLLLEPRPGVRPVWPVAAADGRQAWPEGDRPASRVYTLRRVDVAAGEVDVDFVLHDGDDMPGARFGAEAHPGMVVGMTGPGGGGVKPAPLHLLFGDETALPAIARMLEEMRPGSRAMVFLEIADPAEVQPIRLPPGSELRWLLRQGRPAGTTTLLLDALADVDDAVWHEAPAIFAGCEHAAARDIRHVLKAKGIPRERVQVSAYWKKGEAGA